MTEKFIQCVTKVSDADLWEGNSRIEQSLWLRQNGFKYTTSPRPRRGFFSARIRHSSGTATFYFHPDDSVVLFLLTFG